MRKMHEVKLSSGGTSCCHGNTELKEISLILCREGEKNVCHLQFVSSCLLGTSGLPQFSSVQLLSHVWLCDPMDCNKPGLPVHHQLPEFTQTHVHWAGDAIQSSHPIVPFSSHLQSFQASESFQMSRFFTSGGQSIGDSASASVLPVNVQDWFL